VLSTPRATLDDCLGLAFNPRDVFDVPTVETLASSIDAGRSAAEPADDHLGPILDAPPGLCDEQGRRVIGARDDRSRG